MNKLLLLFVMMATWIVVGCGTSTLGCYGHWVKGPGHHRGTRHMLKDKKLKSGFVKQEDIPFDDFINGKFGAIYQTI